MIEKWLFSLEYDSKELKEMPDVKATDVSGEVLFSSGDVEIVKQPRDPLPRYIVKSPELSKKEKEMMEAIFENFLSDSRINIDKIPEERLEKAVKEEIKRIYLELYPGSPINETIVHQIMKKTIGYEFLDDLLRDENLEEVMVNGADNNVFVLHRKFGMCETNITPPNDDAIKRIIDKIARRVGRKIDHANPLLDARLPDGSRVNATLPLVTLRGPTITIRKFKADPLTIVNLINFNTVPLDFAAFLWLCVDGLGIRPANIIISGGTGSGKTSTLNCLAMFIPENERIITIEDTAELQIRHRHWIQMESKPPNIEGRGEVKMDALVKNCLRMRPDRIIVGEVRGAEATTLFTAMNTGHDGCMSTLHANTARETITRLTNPPMNVPQIMIPALDIILMQSRFRHREIGTVRRITEVSEIAGIEEGKIQLNTIYKYDPITDTLKETGVPSRVRMQLAESSGFSGAEINKEQKIMEIVLNYMVIRGITDLESVRSVVREYYTDRHSLIEKIQREIR